MSRTPRSWWRGLGLLALATCTKPRTEIVVTVRSEIPWGPTGELQSLVVNVRRGGPNGQDRHQQANPLSDDPTQWNIPLVFGLYPIDADDTTPVWVEVLGCRSRVPCTTADALVVQRALVTYRAEATASIDLWLAAQCRDVRCDPDERCVRLSGRCEPASLANSDVRPFGSAADASTDAPVMAAQRSCTGAGVPGCGLVEIAGGTFTLGAAMSCEATPTTTCGLRAAPAQTGVTVSAFALDAYEVSVARFRVFWSARQADGGASIRARPIAYPNGTSVAWGRAGIGPLTGIELCNWSESPDAGASREAHPINCVDWWTAQEFCVWDGGRLPTETEWEYAARGRSAAGLSPGRLYPWGDAAPAPTCDRARWNRAMCSGEGSAPTRPVGSFPTGASAGLFDLAGNVREWTADTLEEYNTAPLCSRRRDARDPLCHDATDPSAYRVFRGGSWDNNNDTELRATSRVSIGAGERLNSLGFRCARSR
jgi:formylglycine-generating enzyme required for sulfatase activity